MSTSPSARSLKTLRDLGYTCQVVERWCQYSRRRIDLFGIIDLLAVKVGEPVLAIQATSTSNISHRLHKALEEPRLLTWLNTGACFEIWGWSKKGARGQVKRWTLTRRPLTLEEVALSQSCA